MRIILVLLFGVLLVGCSKKSDPKPPVAAILVFPNKDSECTTGRDLNETTSEIEFKWMASDHTESYELRVTNLNTSITQTINTMPFQPNCPLPKENLFLGWYGQKIPKFRMWPQVALGISIMQVTLPPMPLFRPSWSIPRMELLFLRI